MKAEVRPLIVVPSINDGGASRFNLDLAAALRRLGIAVEQFTMRAVSETVPHGFNGGKVITGMPPGMRFRYAYPLMLVHLLRAAIAATVVMSGWEVGDGLVAAYIAASAARRPIVGEVGADPIGSLQSIVQYRWAPSISIPAAQWIYPRLDAVTCASVGLGPRVREMGVQESRINAIPNGIDTARIRALAAEPAPDWLPDGEYVLGIGRLARQKGFDVMIEAHARLRAQGSTHKLVLIGEGPERAELERRARARGVADSVLMPGFVENPMPALARTSLFCLSSRYEGFGLVIAEALTLGVPVVSTDCVSGPSELLDGGRHGDLVDVDSSSGLTEAIRRHLEAPEVLRGKARAAAERDLFSIDRCAEQYAEIFERLSAKRPITR